MRASLAAVLLLCMSCKKDPPAVIGVDAASPAPQFIAKRFEELYPVFLTHGSMPEGDKARLWSELRDHWVRWDGVIVSFNGNGVTIRELLDTVTFDVSLTCETSQIATLKARFQLGDRVRYVGRLDSYDDVFRTMYLVHGAVLDKLPVGDLGVPADLSR